MKQVKLIITLLLTLGVLTGCNSSSSSGGSLADQLVGTFTGTITNPTIGILTNYQIVVTKISDSKVRIAPATGSVSQTFEATLSLSANGVYTELFVASDILATNGTYADSTSGLSYSIHLGGSDDGNIELFNGTR